MSLIASIVRNLGAPWRMPRATVRLMLEATGGNDPFYARTVREFHAAAVRRHRKFPLVGAMEYGVALCRLPETFDAYFMSIDAAGRRNVKKAQRNGYTFSRIDYNRHLDGIREIRLSAPVRQGRVPADFANVTPCSDPPSLTRTHDYAYYGVLRDGALAAYAGVFVSGELAMVNHILGHAAHQQNGVVPMLIVSVARELLEKYPAVTFYGYGTYFGCGTTLRRFKRKFGFVPHRVRWVL